MRIAKSRKHEKVQARKRVKAWIKTHSITSRGTKNRRTRVVMDSVDVRYTIIDGIVYT